MSQPPPITCGDRSGFLFAHACDRLAASQCARCARPICIEHTRMTETGPTCVTCLRDESWGRDRDRDRSSVEVESAGPQTPSEEPFTPRGGEFGGAGAAGAWAPGEGPRYAKADDPYFYGAADEPGSAYDADDLAAFSPAAASADDDASADTDTIDSDTGAS